MNRIQYHENSLLAALTLMALTASGIAPYDRLTWWMETLPVTLGLPLLFASRRTFPLTAGLSPAVRSRPDSGAGRALHLCAGWLLVADAFELARNHYDRLGHLAQGFIPAVLTREILLRQTPLKPGGWLFFLTTCVVLAFSASYEFTEWGAARVMGADADAFLATQGDVWDTQWDMLLALIGGLVSQGVLSRLHNKQIKQLTGS